MCSSLQNVYVHHFFDQLWICRTELFYRDHILLLFCGSLTFIGQFYRTGVLDFNKRGHCFLWLENVQRALKKNSFLMSLLMMQIVLVLKFHLKLYSTPRIKCLDCCVFWPASGHSASCLLIKIIFFYILSAFSVINRPINQV